MDKVNGVETAIHPIIIGSFLDYNIMYMSLLFKPRITLYTNILSSRTPVCRKAGGVKIPTDFRYTGMQKYTCAKRKSSWLQLCCFR